MARPSGCPAAGHEQTLRQPAGWQLKAWAVHSSGGACWADAAGGRDTARGRRAGGLGPAAAAL